MNNIYLEGDPIEALQERQRTFDQHVRFAMTSTNPVTRKLNRDAALEVQAQIQWIISEYCFGSPLMFEAAKRALEDA